MTLLSCHRFRSNEVRLWLRLIAYNLGNLWRRLVLPNRIGNWSLTNLQQRLVKTGGRLIKRTRYYWLLLAERQLTGCTHGCLITRWRLECKIAAVANGPGGVYISAAREAKMEILVNRRMDNAPRPHSASPNLRVGAIAGFFSIAFSIPAFLLVPTISQALDPSAVDRGFAQLASHRTLALVCQNCWALWDIASIVFIWPVAAMARPAGRSLAWLGALLTTVSSAMDVLVAASLITATRFIAPHAATDPAMHAAGSALLGFASVIDSGEGYLGSIGFLALGVSAWRGQWCPRWLAVIAVVIGAMPLPPWPQFAGIYLYYLWHILAVIWVTGMSILLWRRVGDV
jgi:hypothetical protein